MNANFTRATIAAATLFLSCHAHALSIDVINISTGFGYEDDHYPVTYPDYDRFGILGSTFSYQLSNGEVLAPGAGSTPYSNGELVGVDIDGEDISYRFGRVHNWIRGDGIVFFTSGQIDCPSCEDPRTPRLWTEAELAPASPIILKAKLGSTLATLEGTAKIVFNHTSGHGENDANFVPFGLPEGAIVKYTATYTLLDATWNADTFAQHFSYQMTGKIYVSSVPEPESLALMLGGLMTVGVSTWITRKKT